MVEKEYTRSREYMEAQVTEFIDGRTKEDFIDVSPRSVFGEYCGWCEEHGAANIGRYNLTRTIGKLLDLATMPAMSSGGQIRVFRRKTETCTVRMKSPEPHMSYSTWERLSFERMDEFMRVMGSFEGMDYEQVFREYEEWCDSLEYVPLGRSRFKAVFGRRWKDMGGCTKVEKVDGRCARILHDPPSDFSAAP